MFGSLPEFKTEDFELPFEPKKKKQKKDKRPEPVTRHGHYTTKKIPKNKDRELPPVRDAFKWKYFTKGMDIIDFMKGLVANGDVIAADLTEEATQVLRNKQENSDGPKSMMILSQSLIAAVEYVYSHKYCRRGWYCLAKVLSNKTYIKTIARFKTCVKLFEELAPFLIPPAVLSNTTSPVNEFSKKFRNGLCGIEDKEAWGEDLHKMLSNHYSRVDPRYGHHLQTLTQKEYLAQVFRGNKEFPTEDNFLKRIHSAIVNESVQDRSSSQAAKRLNNMMKNPIHMREDQVHSFATYYKKLSGSHLWKETKQESQDEELQIEHTYKGLKDDVDINWKEFVVTKNKNVTLSDAGCGLTNLLQMCIGSRLKGITMTNFIHMTGIAFPERKTKETFNKEADNLQETEEELDNDTKKTVMGGFFNTLEHMLTVRRLSKEQKTSRKQYKQNLAEEETKKEEVVDKVIVKPTLWMFLTGKDFMRLWVPYRKACKYVWEKSQKKYTDWPVESEDLHSNEADKMVNAISTRCTELIQTFCEKRRWSYLLAHNKGTHFNRKMYVAYGYQVFSRDRTKDVAFAQYVLSHKSALVSLRYTDLHLEMSIQCNDEPLDVQVSRKIAEMESKLSDAIEHGSLEKKQSEEDRIRQLVKPLDRVRFSEEDIKKGLDVKRVLNKMRDWKEHGVTPTEKNMRKYLKIGKQLSVKVRAKDEFKKLYKEYYRD